MMASSSGKKKGQSASGSSSSKGSNSRTGGKASARAPKPRDERVEDEPRAQSKAASGSSRAKSKKPIKNPQPQPRAGRAKGSGSSNGKRAEVIEDDYPEDDYGDEEPSDDAPVTLGDRGRLFFTNLMNPAPAGEREKAPPRTKAEPVEELLPDGSKVPRWGMGDVALAFFVGLFVPQILLFMIVAALGYTFAGHAADLGGMGGPVGEAVGHVAIGQAPAVVHSVEYAPILLKFVLPEVLLWASLMGVTAWAVIKKGNGFKKDLKLRAKWTDVPIGLAIGLACQLILMPAVYFLVSKFTDEDVTDVARRITDLATDPFSAILVFLSVGIGAPLVEEIYYRGLTLRSVEKRFGPGWALAGTSAFFAVTHGVLIYLPGIFLFAIVLGLLTQRTDRLGPAIFAHMGFNLVTASVLVFHLNVPLV